MSYIVYVTTIDVWARYGDRFGRVAKLDVRNTGVMVSVAGPSDLTHYTDPPSGHRHITDDRTGERKLLEPVERHSDTTLRLVDRVPVPDPCDSRLTLRKRPPAGGFLVNGPGTVYQVFGREPEIRRLEEEWSREVPSGLSFRIGDGPEEGTCVAVLYNPAGRG